MTDAESRFPDSVQRAGIVGAVVRCATASSGSTRLHGGSGVAVSRLAGIRIARLAISAFALLPAMVVLAALASPAAQAKDLVGWFGNASGSGTLGGQINNPRDIGVNRSGAGPADQGDIYVVDENNHRIQRFDSEGNFVSAWGADVFGINEQQQLDVSASGGTFTLEFEGETTAPIAENANGATVAAALELLPAIGVGNVEATGFSGTKQIFFIGEVGGTDVPELVPDSTGLTGQGEEATITTVINGEGGPGDDYEICTEASLCSAGLPTGGNPSDNLQNGAMDNPQSVAVDNDTGNVYVSDRDNRRINEYDGVGNFIRSFGWDVDADEPGVEFEICPAVDRCQAGVAGSGIGQIGSSGTAGILGIAVSPANGEPADGTVFVADSGNRRVNTYGLDGASPSSFGSATEFGSPQPRNIAVDSRGIVYASNSNNGNEIERYDSENANGGGEVFLEPLVSFANERQTVHFEGFSTNDAYTLTCPNGETTDEIVWTTAVGTLQNNMRTALESKCGGSYSIFSGPNNPQVTFEGTLGATNIPKMTCTTTSGAGTCEITSELDGHAGVLLPSQFGSTATSGLAVDPDLDGAGPEEDILHILRDPSSGNTVVQQVGPVNDPGLAIAPTADDEQHATGAGFSTVQGFGVDPVAGTLYVSATNNVSGIGSGHRVYVIGEAPPPTATVDSITDVTPKSAKINGTINPNTSTSIPNPPPTSAHLEFKLSTDSDWTPYGVGADIGLGTSDVPVTQFLGGLIPNRSYDVRFVATTQYGAVSYGAAETFSTLPAAPKIEGFRAMNVTKNTVDFAATINPLGQDTTYRFEYGPTLGYGGAAPIPDGEVTASPDPQKVVVHVENLQGIPYHFRVVAENEAGTSTSGDQTFSFYPEPCPNSFARQQTGAGHVPDCRAYELVTPSEAGTINLFAAGAFSPEASHPPRVMVAGNFGTLEGVNAPNFLFDPYVATRTSTGWDMRYAGIPADIAGGVAGQPGKRGAGGVLNAAPLADKNLDTILHWRFGPPSLFGEFFYIGTRHYSPYVYGPNGESKGRYPTNLAEVPGADNPIRTPLFEIKDDPENGWAGDQLLSENGAHYFFSTNRYAFAPGGLVSKNEGPGSVYDNNVETGEVTIASKVPGTLEEGNIAAEEGVPAAAAKHFLETFAASTDGSHLLIGAPAACPGGDSYFLCRTTEDYVTAHLYMRVDGAVTYDVSQGYRVDLEGMTRDGSRVYFTSAQAITGDDHDESTDLFMWSELTDDITRLSVGFEGEIGNLDNCAATWISKCGIQVVPATGGQETQELKEVAIEGPTDNSIAVDSGDIYFYSPEQLVASDATPNGKNLYVRHGNGDIAFVTTLEAANNRRITRIQVTPSGSHAAFVTASPLTAYDNAGLEMMYLYDTEKETLTCVSCDPSGAPPGNGVIASLNGIFLSDDGRPFWVTADPLVPRDTNQDRDVYGYSGGRAQLITSGISEKVRPYEVTGSNFFGKSFWNKVGLVGVSADGMDVYFTTTDSLVPQDHNGKYLKMYDARTNGGFPVSAQVAPCEAADECHGATNSQPTRPTVTSTANLGRNGNAARRRRAQRRRAQRRRRAAQRRAHRKRKQQNRKRHSKRHHGRAGK